MGFLKYPIELSTDPRYKALPAEARILYIHMRARRVLSQKNGITDDSGRAYIFFRRKEMSELLGVSEVTACRLVKKLREAGLVSMGSKITGTSTRIYVHDVKSRDKHSTSFKRESIDDVALRQFLETRT